MVAHVIPCDCKPTHLSTEGGSVVINKDPVGEIQRHIIQDAKAYLWGGEEGMAGPRNCQVVVTASRKLKHQGAQV